LLSSERQKRMATLNLSLMSHTLIDEVLSQKLRGDSIYIYYKRRLLDARVVSVQCPFVNKVQ